MQKIQLTRKIPNKSKVLTSRLLPKCSQSDNVFINKALEAPPTEVLKVGTRRTAALISIQLCTEHLNTIKLRDTVRGRVSYTR